MSSEYAFLTDAQLHSEIGKCEYCAEKPCKIACPAHCSPADFIMAVRKGETWDYQRAAAEILRNNPLGGICGVVCPDYHCMKACVHLKFDSAVDIPKLQAAIIARTKQEGAKLDFIPEKTKAERVAIIGAGPAGLAAAAVLTQRGYKIDIYEARSEAGGACNLIPEHRLPGDVLKNDIQFVLSMNVINLFLNHRIESPEILLSEKYQAVLLAAGLWTPIRLGIDNEDAAISGLEYLSKPERYPLNGNVAVIGGGATACDCAMTALRSGASNVEIYALETLGEMPLTQREKNDLIDSEINVNGRSKVTGIVKSSDRITGMMLRKVKLSQSEESFHLDNISDITGTDHVNSNVDHVIVAIGAKSDVKRVMNPALFYAGDFENGPTSVVEAVASGKNSAEEIDAYLSKRDKPFIEKNIKSSVKVSGYKMRPLPLETDFFGRSIRSPFLLSASPVTDGLEQMTSAYEAGWAGGIMKTAFHNIPIHIPGEYMHQFDGDTYGNCDNVSGHSLDRMCDEIRQLIKLYPDRMTIGSTGGAVSGDDQMDKKSWQGNTAKLEQAGAMAIEYSLSCPQGGDGTEGDIVSQNSKLSAKIIDWVMQMGDPDIPKLFKLTGAVTSIVPIVSAIKDVFDKYPHKKAGITLANSFPTLFFRSGFKKEWDGGIVVGMSGEGILPISFLSLANVGNLEVTVSGNGGPMDYRAAANFLALGANTVQFCTIVMKYGYAVYDELTSGLSHLLQAKGLKSVAELIGIALPDPVIDFMSLPDTKKVSDCHDDYCLSCGNCTRCPYQAIRLNEKQHPVTDASKCIGCSICVQKCFSGALIMRDRTTEEAASLVEN